MTDPIDYQLANLTNRQLKLRAQRRDILVSDAEKALDQILDAPSPATLIQSFPDQDLYYLMHKIGPDDFVPVLSMATSAQWEYILDVEVWDTDRLDTTITTKVFDLLFQADPQRLLRWGIKEKPAFFEFFLSRQIEIKIREHDEIPPDDFDDYITLDDKFYFRFPEKPPLTEDQMPAPGDHTPAWELTEKMLKLLAQMDLSVFHGLLLETSSLLPAEIEEEEFRLKNLRLAEKGFLPTHDAIGIYQPLSVSGKLRNRPQKTAAAHELDPQIPLPPQFFSEHLNEDDLFVAALRDIDSRLLMELESELAALINKVISADKIKLRQRQDLEKAVHKTHAYLNLGLEVMLKKDATVNQAQKLISQFYLEDIFRNGSSACIKLKTEAVRWFKNSFMNQNRLPLSFLDEKYLGIIGGLFIERPMFFDNYQSGALYRDFKTISDIDATRKNLNQIMALDLILEHLSVDIDSFEEGVLTYKTCLLTLWARDRLDLEPTLSPIDIAVFKNFFGALFTATESGSKFDLQLSDLQLWITQRTGLSEEQQPEAFTGVLKDLMAELDQEYGRVDSKNLDPRYIPHFLLK